MRKENGSPIDGLLSMKVFFKSILSYAATFIEAPDWPVVMA